ncbi:superoxide dismutase family protein [Leptolyngbya sp. AN02str]|uniref:superoxide dismutase family protein n=1 Tax=Leptolyngbya sp. AN02str TaxID=3423363 RepID=UPI003D31A945
MSVWRRVAKSVSVITILGLLLFLYLGVQGQALAATMATADIHDTGNGALSGQATFTETETGLIIRAQVANAPVGFHGFHIHEGERCEDGGKAAGGHYNPDGVKHGKLVTDGFANAHAGDLGNLVIGLGGSGTYQQEIPGLRLTEGAHAIANRAVIVHEKMDVYVQPTGNAGDRIGCGVIRLES